MKVNKKRFRVTRLMGSGVRGGVALAGEGDLARGAWLVWETSAVCANAEVWRHRLEL